MKAISMKLQAKRETLLAENNKYADRVRLSNTLLFSTLRKEVSNNCKIRAIDMVLEILQNGINSIDLDYYATDIIHPQRTDREEWLHKAFWGTYSEKRDLLIFLIQTYLPVCKKQVLTLIH